MSEQTLEELLGSGQPSPNEVVNGAAKADEYEVKPEETSAKPVEGKTLEVGGVMIEDGLGNTWQVPAGNTEDLDDLYAGNVYKFPESLTKDFHVQLIPITRLREYVARKFVPVRLSEVGIPQELQATTGQPLDSFHTVGDSILVKIPRVIFDRINAAKVKEVKDRLAQLEPTEEMKKKAQQSGVVLRVERKQSADVYRDIAKRPGLGLEDGGK